MIARQAEVRLHFISLPPRLLEHVHELDNRYLLLYDDGRVDVR